MAVLTGVFYEGDGFIRRGPIDTPVNAPAAKQDACTDVRAEATKGPELEPSIGNLKIELQARALRREYVNQWFRSLFDK